MSQTAQLTTRPRHPDLIPPHIAAMTPAELDAARKTAILNDLQGAYDRLKPTRAPVRGIYIRPNYLRVAQLIAHHCQEYCGYAIDIIYEHIERAREGSADACARLSKAQKENQREPKWDFIRMGQLANLVEEWDRVVEDVEEAWKFVDDFEWECITGQQMVWQPKKK